MHWTVLSSLLTTEACKQGVNISLFQTRLQFMLENFNNQKIISTSIYDNKPTIKEQQKDY